MRAWKKIRAAIVTVALGATACGGGDGVDVEVESVEPAEGPVNGGQEVIVTGSGFLAGGAAPNMALFGERLTTNVSALSDTELLIVTPPGAVIGEVDLLIFNANGAGTAAGAYTYLGPPELEAVDPASGHYTGGDEVTITGTGFLDLGAGRPTITFEGHAATEVTVVSDTEMTAIVPKGTPYHNVTVALDNARGRAELPEAYVYTASDGFLAMTGQRVFPPSSPTQGLWYIDRMTGETLHVHSINAIQYRIQALATGDDGTVYAVSANNLLYVLDPQTGALDEIGPLAILGGKGGTGPYRVSALTFLDGTLYASDRNSGRFGSIDTESGLMTLFSDGSYAEYSDNGGHGMATDGEGLFNLWGGQLTTIDPLTGIPSVDNAQTIAPAALTGAAIVGGTLYATQRVSTLFGGGFNAGRVHAIDLETLESTILATVPTSIHGLTVAP